MKIYPVSYNNISRNPVTKNNQTSGAESPVLSNFQPEKNRTGFSINFTSLKATAEDENKFLDTLFYRDLSSLVSFSRMMKETFPNGADIMDFACSDGEEAISIYTLLNDKNSAKYKIHCYDTSDKALQLARKNIYMVRYTSSDSFLANDRITDPLYREIKKKFNTVMEEIPVPEFSQTDSEFASVAKSLNIFYEKYFKIKDEYKKEFKFQKGDIRDILNIMPEKQVGAVFFKNAFYHLTNNHPYGKIYDEETLDKIWNTDKAAIIEDVVDKVYEKLLRGGFFVIGTHEKEHIYQADKFTPKKDIFYDELHNEYLNLKSPLEKALRKDGRFEPVVSAKCQSSGMGYFTVYTVWKKVK